VPYDSESRERYGKCTLSSGTLHNDFEWMGWTTAAHCLPCPGNYEGAQLVEHWADLEYRYLGYVVVIDINLDIAIIKNDSGANEISEVASPKEPDKQLWRNEIAGTANFDGLTTLAGDDDTHFIKKGISSCLSSGNITSIGGNKYVYSLDDFCENVLEDQVEWDAETKEGDSGSLVYSSPYEGNRYASHSHSGRSLGKAFGPAGYRIRNEYGVWWDD